MKAKGRVKGGNVGQECYVQPGTREVGGQKKDPTDKRTAQIVFYCTPNEDYIIRVAAKLVKKDISDFVKSAVIHEIYKNVK